MSYTSRILNTSKGTRKRFWFSRFSSYRDSTEGILFITLNISKNNYLSRAKLLRFDHTSELISITCDYNSPLRIHITTGKSTYKFSELSELEDVWLVSSADDRTPVEYHTFHTSIIQRLFWI